LVNLLLPCLLSLQIESSTSKSQRDEIVEFLKILKEILKQQYFD